MNEIHKLLAQCTVRIQIDTHQFATGFFIGKGMVLTCAHVAVKLDSHSKVIWNEQSYNIKKCDVSSDYAKTSETDITNSRDIAIVEIDCMNTDFALLGGDMEYGQSCYSYAYTKVDYAIVAESVTFVCEGVSGDLYKVKNGVIKSGMSGAAVLNEKTGLVCGIIKATREEEMDLGGYIVPINHKTLEGLKINFQEQLYEFSHTTWANSLDREQREAYNKFWTVRIDDIKLMKKMFKLAREYCDKLFSYCIPGAEHILFRDVLSNDMLLPLRGVRAHDKKDIQDILSFALKKIKEQGQKGVLFVANPGAGKTTLGYVLFDKLLAETVENETPLIPIFIDMSIHMEDEEKDFGTKHWLEKYLKTRYNVDEQLFLFIERNRKRLVFIFEGIDEYLAIFSLEEIIRIFEREIFSYGKVVISCRTQNYERYMGSINLIRQLERITICALNSGKINKYLKNYFRFLKVGRNKQKQIKQILFQNTNLRTLATNPLHLNMLLELIVKEKICAQQVFGIMSLYRQYIFVWLKSEEIKRRNHALSIEEKIEILQEVAWRFFEDSQFGRDDYTYFTRRQLQDVLFEKYGGGNVEEILDEIIHSTFLMESAYFHSNNTFCIRFIHKSFQEYFIAAYYFRVMQEDSERLTGMMHIYISAYISEFLREFLLEEFSNSRMKEKIAKNCIIAFNMNCCGDIEDAKKRVAREQLAYYMGTLRINIANEFLRTKVDEELDVWVRRGIILGLAFGLNTEYQDTYVERLRTERKMEKTTIENDCNIGFTLSFFGDQPFNILYPDRDMGYPKCENTIERMLYLFNTESDFGGWRINLYTIIDMYKYRTISRHNLVLAIKKNLSGWEEILKKFQMDDRCKEWPEISEMEELISEIKEK